MNFYYIDYYGQVENYSDVLDILIKPVDIYVFLGNSNESKQTLATTWCTSVTNFFEEMHGEPNLRAVYFVNNDDECLNFVKRYFARYAKQLGRK